MHVKIYQSRGHKLVSCIYNLYTSLSLYLIFNSKNFSVRYKYIILVNGLLFREENFPSLYANSFSN